MSLILLVFTGSSALDFYGKKKITVMIKKENSVFLLLFTLCKDEVNTLSN